MKENEEKKLLEELGPLPRRHPRSVPVARARTAIGQAIDDAQAAHGLTYSELWLILSEISAGMAAVCVRSERGI